MSHLKIVKTFKNETAGELPASRMVAYGSTGMVVLATDGTKSLAGTTEYGCSSEGDSLGVVIGGVPTMAEAGDAIAPGDFVTAGADGKAVKAVAGDFYAGVAQDAGAADEYFWYLPSPGLLPADATP